MHAYLATRPAGFDSLRDAVEWHVRSRTVRNAVSARASVPGLLVQVQEQMQGQGRERTGQAGCGDVEGVGALSAGAVGGVDEDGDASMEEAAGEGGTGLKASAAVVGNGKGGDKPWRWRTDLAKTQPFWEGWFDGLSKKFLAGRGGKMLLLAGTDRLDTELTIGQMQGTYLFIPSLASPVFFVGHRPPREDG